ncbi:MAG: PIN domain-containing protein [Thermoplasmatota archaeon]
MKGLDTCFFIDLLRKDEDAVRKAERLDEDDENLVTTQMNVYELFVGVYSSKDIDKEKHIKRIEQILDKTMILDMNSEASKRSAEIAGNLISKGKRIEIPDTITAGIMLSKGIDAIITRNKEHFERIKGLDIEEY